MPDSRMSLPRNIRLRRATREDAEEIAFLHAESWRHFYRGAYADAFLDGDIYTDRLTVWRDRLEHRDSAALTVVADEEGRGLVAFVHVILDEDPRWGALVDNLHVSRTHHRQHIGTSLLEKAIRLARENGTGLYLWVQEQNTAARAFYSARGARVAEQAPISPPGGVPSRLAGRPMKLRCVWTRTGRPPELPVLSRAP